MRMPDREGVFDTRPRSDKSVRATGDPSRCADVAAHAARLQYNHLHSA